MEINIEHLETKIKMYDSGLLDEKSKMYDYEREDDG